MNQTLPVVCTVKVIYAYIAKEEGDLNLKKGDIINVHDNEGGWWNGTLLHDGSCGTFPSNFVELINNSDDSLDSVVSPTRPSRQHTRHGSVDSSKFTKRKPVNVVNINTPTDNINNSTISLGARKNPQAIIGDSGLCSTIPGAFPTLGSQSNTTTDAQRRNSTNTATLNPSGPNSSFISPQAASGKHVTNRYSMPNLARDTMDHQPRMNATQDGQRPMPLINNKNNINQDLPSTPATRNSVNSPNGRYYSENSGSAAHPSSTPNKHEIPLDHNYSGDPSHFQPGMMPRSPADNYHHRFSTGANDSSQMGHSPIINAPGRKTSIHSIGAFPLEPPSPQHGAFSANPLDLSLENLINHNRSQNGLSRGHSISQSNLRTEMSPAMSPLDQYRQSQMFQHQQNNQPHSTPMARLTLGPRSLNPSIVIPPFRQRRQSAMASFGSTQLSPTDSSPSSAGGTIISPQYSFLGSPNTPDSALSKDSCTPISAGTSMSETSSFGSNDFRKKSETARMPPSTPMMSSNFTTRKFSVDANRLVSSLADMTLTSNPPSSDVQEETNEDLENLGTYTARKPKSTLIRAFKQIINPKKVAEKDALRNKNEHFAWIEMQKSLKRVNSLEIGNGQSLLDFFGDKRIDDIHQSSFEPDPFDFIRRCQAMRDVAPTTAAATTATSLDFGPNTFSQVDKVARNVNQRGNHLTPQVLSQKYLTRPYSKSPISKLRVLFVWVSENIRLEGGPTRDVSGGRYKLGPGGDYLTALAAMANTGESPSLRSGAMAPPPAAFMTGVEEYTRGFLQEDTPELAQDVLTTRTCKTGEGFANLFAEMALAAGIEDVGVVKGHVKGPMDVFSKDIPQPNHAWNVVRIDGTYRFIDCCLASPFHPAHYPSRPQSASSFYFLTSPTDMALSHCPIFLTYQYITPSIPPQIFLQLPFVRPAYFDYGLSLPNFKKLTKLDIRDDEPIEIVVRIDGSRGVLSGIPTNGQSNISGPIIQGTSLGHYGGECMGRGCGEGIELRAEVETMNGEGKVIRKRAFAQVMIWNPYQYNTLTPPQSLSQMSQGISSSTLSVASGVNAVPGNRPPQSHHCTGIRIAKIKAVLPPETVICPSGVRKGVVHIYAGRKVESAPNDATPYSLAMTLPVRHTGSMPKTPLNFVHQHFSPYQFYVKAPQTELLYYPHTYKFSIISLAAQAQATLASANAQVIGENESNSAAMGVNSSAATSTMTSPRHLRHLGGSGTPIGSSSLNPLYRPQQQQQQQQQQQNLRGLTSSSAQTLLLSGSHSAHGSRMPLSSTLTSMGTMRSSHKNYPYHHQHYKINSSSSMASSSSSSVASGIVGNEGALSVNGGIAVPRPERLILRTQSNRTYKLVYDPIRHCHETQIDVKERGIWECVRLDDGGRNRVGREGTGGVVIASWRCV